MYSISFVASPPRVAPLEPHVEEQNVGALVSSQEEHRVVDSPSDIATAHLDAVVGEGSDNYPPPVSVADAGRPSTSGPSTLLLSRSGEEMARFGRIERLVELVSSWEAYGAKLKVMY